MAESDDAPLTAVAASLIDDSTRTLFRELLAGPLQELIEESCGGEYQRAVPRLDDVGQLEDLFERVGNFRSAAFSAPAPRIEHGLAAKIPSSGCSISP